LGRDRKMLQRNWLGMSIIGMLAIIPSWLGVGFFEKNFQVRPEVFMIWYFFGVIGGSVCFLVSKEISILPSISVWLAIVIIGITFGSVANMLLFAATPIAPNPGLPAAIASFASVVILFLSVGLYSLLPSYFNHVQFDMYHFFGMILAGAGMLLMAMPR